MASAPDDFIGIKSAESIEAVAATIAAALGVTLSPHESSFLGDPYYSGWPSSELNVTSNLDPSFAEGDPLSERWFAPHASDVQYLIWNTDDPAGVVEALTQSGLDARLVRRHPGTLIWREGRQCAG